MFNIVKRIAAGLLVSGLLMSTVIVPVADQGAGQVQARQVLSARVNAGILKVRAKEGTTSQTLKILHRNDRVRVLTTGNRWVKVQSGKVVGYTQGKLLITGYGGTAADEGGYSRGQQVANFALRFVGNPYRYGGTSLTNGTDCSGFVMSVYRHFGKKLPRTSSSQRHAGRGVGSLSAAKPGDIICYNGHVAIYLGNRKIVHASNRRTGIKVTNNAAYRHIVAIRRVF